MRLPRGFTAHVGNIGIKDQTNDFLVVVSEVPCAASAVFTKSRFAGPSIVVSREHAADHQLQAVTVISKNANVATGIPGENNARELVKLVSESTALPESSILVASTGVIGRQYPMDRIRSYLGADSQLRLEGLPAVRVAEAMMTTDTHPKVAMATVGDATIVGVAKGVGMIEPDMATMLAFVFTDAAIDATTLDTTFRSVVGRTFNSLSVDTDTSTSDTAAVLANGLAGSVDRTEFAAALEAVCLNLTLQLASDGEGATKLLTVTVTGARDDDQAKRVAKAILNSPLVKTAVHGADPNWGRVAMAIGKCSDETDIDPDHVAISFGGTEVYPNDPGESGLAALEDYLRGDSVEVQADLGIANGRWTVYGCDLSDGYVRINADYTT
ncbi:MAG: bifunctional glutamate N-acetyltransferase/amino-acid acetyltransferase ArgJ [Microthrixaceae bacterium]|nr:bifunctional glutamate N-acetyltransferase/amino-acid acetyltransferase ArgJ [Microthrixaceae bacterium]